MAMDEGSDAAGGTPARHSTRGLLLRILGAVAVVIGAILIKDAVLDGGVESQATAGSRVIDWRVESELLGEELPVSVVIPPGARDGRRSLLVFLHGRGDDHETYLEEEMFDALDRQGGRAPVVAFPRGGPDSYWHDREDGEWGSYVTDELVPRLVRRFEIEPERIAIGGISMGGFGAFDIAARQPGTFCAVGGHSPAVWLDASATAPGAFDDEQDFAEHDVIEEVGPPGSPLDGKRFWIDVGAADPFAEADAELAEQLIDGGAKGRLFEGEGGHEAEYWSSNWRRYMHFYARALKRCQQEAAAEAEGDEGTERNAEG